MKKTLSLIAFFLPYPKFPFIYSSEIIFLENSVAHNHNTMEKAQKLEPHFIPEFQWGSFQTNYHPLHVSKKALRSQLIDEYLKLDYVIPQIAGLTEDQQNKIDHILSYKLPMFFSDKWPYEVHRQVMKKRTKQILEIACETLHFFEEKLQKHINAILCKRQELLNH